MIIHPRRGIEVARISPKRIRDIFEIRSLLEPQILRMGMERIDKAWLRHMRDEFLRFSGSDFDLSSQDTIQLSTLDNQFHMGIINSIDDIRFGPSNVEHIAIIDAMLENNIEDACNDLTEHLARSYEESINIVMNTTI